MKEYYSIGAFSKITGLSAKALRFYHEKGVLDPSSVDNSSGYRYYDSGKIEKARVVMWLRQMEFSIEDIAAIFAQCDDDADILGFLERHKEWLRSRISQDRDSHDDSRFLDLAGIKGGRTDADRGHPHEGPMPGLDASRAL